MRNDNWDRIEENEERATALNSQFSTLTTRDSGLSSTAYDSRLTANSSQLTAHTATQGTRHRHTLGNNKPTSFNQAESQGEHSESRARLPYRKRSLSSCPSNCSNLKVSPQNFSSVARASLERRTATGNSFASCNSTRGAFRSPERVTGATHDHFVSGYQLSACVCVVCCVCARVVCTLTGSSSGSFFTTCFIIISPESKDEWG